MPLFQNSVVRKHLSTQDKNLLTERWKIFTAHFHNTVVQENIRNSNEVQYQGEFLIDLFVNVLGYTKNPTPDFNLTTEYKNIKDSKKADGAIIINEKVVAVIELKGTNTTDLSKIETQAFGYKNNQSDCTYVITSNYEKLRFYIDNAIEHFEFNLFELSENEFELMYLCLAYANIAQNIPQKIKTESLSQEDAITKKLYSDYSVFKRDLFQNLQKLNPQYDPLELFKKSQKLIDRFLFLFFAEDRQLLPPNSVRLIVDDWLDLKERDAYIPLYKRFKKYFEYLNTGYKGKRYDVFAYNGGLFAHDDILDTIKIDDEILYKHTVRLAEYDFASEIDVNILGHIFEHSLNELDEMKSELEGQSIVKSNTKRKKDGVFYTPKYITKYIVDNTVGKLCSEKKEELQIIEEEYSPSTGTRGHAPLTIREKKNLLEKLTTYRNWLLQLTICDPACGSGAFLNQALNFLIVEHRYIDELQAKLFGDAMVLSDVEMSILEKNLFGVDINEESVEIAKLSLWLRSAKPNRKLNILSNNIKCGNSLIDDPAVAGDKAFDWHKEFPQVFEKGGFDVVIGNPPYVRAELLGFCRDYLMKNYSVFNSTGDLFSYFYEQSFKLLKPDRVFGFISNTFDKTTAGISLREYLQNEVNILKYVDLTEVQIFEGATTYPVIIIAKNEKPAKQPFSYIKIPKASQSSFVDIDFYNAVDVSQQSLNKENWSFKSNQGFELIDKLKQNKTVRNVYGKCNRGIVTGFNDAFIVDNMFKENVEKKSKFEAEIIKQLIEGKDVEKWIFQTIDKCIIFSRRGIDIENFTTIKEHLEKFKVQLTPRTSKDNSFGRKPGRYKWFEIQDSVDYYKNFEKPKVVFPNLQNKNKFAYDETGAYINAPAVILPTEDRFLTAILNSKLVWYFLTNICVVRNGGYIEVKPQYFEQIPIPNISDDNKSKLEQFTKEIIFTTAEKQRLQTKFIKLLQSKFTDLRITKRIENWFEMEYSDFKKELSKQGKKMSLSEESEWIDYLEEQNKHHVSVSKEIIELEKEIDRMVYELYGLTEDEIRIVEGG